LAIVLGGAQAARAAAAVGDHLIFVARDAESVVQVVAQAVSANPGR
ncbi:MAG: hypothetical protein QOI80_3357, partial [Solirubrobacteraceae bacterium]|nr:hypothetical protein [Solirubrobacteraceae bacterium]